VVVGSGGWLLLGRREILEVAVGCNIVHAIVESLGLLVLVVVLE
jgi:hypothetical protein